MRKAQTEMIGLVIVLIILSLAALFAIKFLVLDKKSNENFKDNSLSIQANNILNAVIKSNTNFPNCKKNLGELIGTCCEGLPDSERCDKSCDNIKLEIESILNKVNLKYSFNICSITSESSDFNVCTDVISSSPYLILGKQDTYDASLKVCKP